MTTALEILADRCAIASKSANDRRASQTMQEQRAVCMRSYREGEAAAYNDARKLMETELRRLCNRMQNGCLTISDFGIVL